MCEQIETVLCNACNISCRNKNCFKLHQNLLCKKIHKCEKCNYFKRKYTKHVCIGQKYCSNCDKVVDLEHKCYILTTHEKNSIKSIKKTHTKGYIWFDYEAYHCEKTLVQIPNLIVAIKNCFNCIYGTTCNDNCGEFVFEDNHSFCSWLYSIHNYYYTAFAHNAKGYDGMFLLQWIRNNLSFESREKMPTLLMNGTKILSMTFRNVKLLDSMSFLPMGLDKFAKTFNLKELKKGYFCHLFNKPKNINYIGAIPSKKYFEPQLFNDEKLKAFNKWYEEQHNHEYNFRKELLEYCRSDVLLLKEGILAFRKIILDKTNIDPYEESITLSSLAHLIYRTNMMPEKSIGIIPINGFNPEQMSSHKAITWLKFLMHKNNIYIQHARNGGEHRIILDNGVKYLVDGYNKQNNTVYEFNG